MFAIAAAAAAAAGSGVVVAAHIDPPGTPLLHAHSLALYRLTLFADAPRIHDIGRTLVDDEDASFDATAALVLALLTLAVPRIPRPTLRAVAELSPFTIVRRQLQPANPHGPPRAALHA